ELLHALQDYIAPIQTNAQVLAAIDCLLCFAENAIQCNYKKPQLHDGFALRIEAGRHPVIERHLPAGENYVSNDITLDPDG
ncbi:hypothetical protein ACSTHH_23550, partial [Vibrio parahaemolyticus]